MSDSVQEAVEAPAQAEEAAPTEAVEGDAQEQQVDDQQPEAPPPTESAPDFSKQFAALARKEKGIRDREGSMKGLQGQVKDLQDEIAGYRSRFSSARENPTQFLQEAGLSMKDIVHHDLNGEIPMESQLTQRLESLEKQNADLLKGQKERLDQAKKSKQDTEWQNYVDGVNKFVENTSKYELIRAGDMGWMVSQLVRDFYVNQQQEITVQQAADLVEESLEEAIEGYLESPKLKTKYKAKFSASEADEEPAGQASDESPRRQKTLTNQHSVKSTEKGTDLLSREESLERMAQILTS